MDPEKNKNSALKVQKGIDQPPSVNPALLTGKRKHRRKRYTADEFVAGITAGDRTILSQAITMVESQLCEHSDLMQEVIERCLPHSGRSIRLGITGIPGAGKSTFIEALGLHITGEGRKLAVLAIDPSSSHTRGSILGDKTRMERLSTHPLAFIRPSPAAGSLGGVARKTRETIILCEAAGFNTIIVETVGVGQSETAVHSMVDFFLLLMLAGTGDELQGIKRGIMEMADLIAINKADGANRLLADAAVIQYRNALTLFPGNASKWKPEVLACSAREHSGIKEIWDTIDKYITLTSSNGYFEEQRKQQAVVRMHAAIVEYLNNSFYNNRGVKAAIPEMEKLLYEGKITSYKAAYYLIDKYHKK